MACVLLAPGLSWGGVLHPPAPPQVAPVISESYSSDRDGDRINDELELAVAVSKGVSITAEDQPVNASGRMVAVELVFREPVTQQQIDSFLALGGQITYLFKAISYGWNSRIPREQIALLRS
jgi:hypothetical protein